MFEFLVFLFFPIANAEITMVTFWGAPNDPQNCSLKNVSDSFEACFNLCYVSATCVIAYQPNETFCFNCYWFEIASIKILDYDVNATKVAAKMNLSTCPAGNISTMAPGQDLRVVSYYFQIIFQYTFSVTLNNLFMNSTQTAVCGPYGTVVQRVTGPRCLYFWADFQPFNYTRAVQQCITLSKTLVAFDTPAEPAFAISVAQTLTNSTIPTIMVRLDGVKRTECHNSTTGACKGISAYDFNVDTLMSTYTGMVFMTNTSGLNSGSCQYADCLQMYYEKGDSRSGQIMEVCCDGYSTFTPFYNAVVCSDTPLS